MEVLERRILTGDQEAFKEWMHLHIKAIEQLAVQFGLTTQDAGEVAETLFGDLYRDTGHLTEERLMENALFKSALQIASGFQIDATEIGFLSFKEDNELHQRLINLSKEERQAFILYRFHEKSMEDIAWIMDKPIEQVDNLLHQAKTRMDDREIEKRLRFLHTSYQRLRPTYNEKNIFYSTPKEPLPSEEIVIKTNRRKKPILLWLAGSVMLILILSITVLRSDAYQQSSAEKFIENKKSSFQQELDDRLELIGLSQPDEASGDSSLYLNGAQIRREIYGANTKLDFDRFIRVLEKQLEDEGKINKKVATKSYDEFVHELRLPSEMLEQLKNEPIKDREQSLDFLNEFTQKNDFLANAYMNVVWEHNDIIFESDLIKDGIVDIEEFMKRKPEFPIELQNAMDGMESQFYSLRSIKDYVPLTLKYDNPEVKETLQNNLHLDADVYIFLIMDGVGGLQFATFQEQMKILFELDKQLPKTKESDPLVDRFDGNYTWLLYSMAGFFDDGGIYERNMTVKEEVQEKWKKLASIGDSSSAGLVMQEIVDEMEASNWKVSFENDIQSQFFERVKNQLREKRKINE